MSKVIPVDIDLANVGMRVPTFPGWPGSGTKKIYYIQNNNHHNYSHPYGPYPAAVPGQGNVPYTPIPYPPPGIIPPAPMPNPEPGAASAPELPPEMMVSTPPQAASAVYDFRDWLRRKFARKPAPTPSAPELPPGSAIEQEVQAEHQEVAEVHEELQRVEAQEESIREMVQYIYEEVRKAVETPG